jgi:hypothetical protein
MSSVGETLRRERLRKDLSLEQISRETKISARLLEAIEKDQFELLPGGVFAKSFVRQYARFLGLDEEEMAAEVEKGRQSRGGLPSFAGRPPSLLSKCREWSNGRAAAAPTLRFCPRWRWWWRSCWSVRRSMRGGSGAAGRPRWPPIAAAQKAPAPVSKPAEPAPVTPAVANNPETAAQDRRVRTVRRRRKRPGAGRERQSGGCFARLADRGCRRPGCGCGPTARVVMSDVLQPNRGEDVAAVDGLRIRTATRAACR